MLAQEGSSRAAGVPVVTAPAATRHAAGAPAAPDPRGAATAEVRLDRQLALFALALHGATQATSLLAWAGMPPWERAQRLLSIVFTATLWVLPTVAPLFYLRWRPHVLAAYRSASSPSRSSARHGVRGASQQLGACRPTHLACVCASPRAPPLSTLPWGRPDHSLLCLPPRQLHLAAHTPSACWAHAQRACPPRVHTHTRTHHRSCTLGTPAPLLPSAGRHPKGA